MDSTLSGLIPGSTCGDPNAGASNTAPTPMQKCSIRVPRQLGDPLPLSSIVHLIGCVEDSDLPSLVEGESRVLGSTMHPKVAKYYRKQDRDWKLAEGRPKGKGWGINSQISVPPTTKKCFVVELQKAAEKLMKKCLVDRIGLIHDPTMAVLPEDIGAPKSVEPRLVGNDDRRVQLRGELALNATQNMKPGFVVGAYRGYTSFLKEHNDLVSGKHPDFPKSFIEWEIMVESYCANDENLITKDKFGNDGAELFVDAVGYGNLAALVNDCSIHPFGPPDKETVEGSQGQDSDKGTPDSDEEDFEGREKEYYDRGLGGQVGQDNCRLLMVIIRGFPFLFLVVTAEIEAGQELLFKYGHLYWSSLQSSIKRLERFNLDSASQLRASTQEEMAQLHEALAGQCAVSDKLISQLSKKDDELATTKRLLEMEREEFERKQKTLNDAIYELQKEGRGVGNQYHKEQDHVEPREEEPLPQAASLFGIKPLEPLNTEEHAPGAITDERAPGDPDAINHGGRTPGEAYHTTGFERAHSSIRFNSSRSVSAAPKPARQSLIVRSTGQINPDIRKDEAKVVDMIKVDEMPKGVFCRCWKSETFPMCNGSHMKHNKETGDNVGPLIIDNPLAKKE
eukprot:gene16351-22550_t